MVLERLKKIPIETSHWKLPVPRQLFHGKMPILKAFLDMHPGFAVIPDPDGTHTDVDLKLPDSLEKTNDAPEVR